MTTQLKSVVVTTGNGTQIRIPKRAVQLMGMLEEGMSNRDIAEKLDISEHTVKVHFWRLFQRLGVNSRGQALKWWRDHRPESTAPNALRAFFDGVCAAIDRGELEHPQVAYLRAEVERSMRGSA